MSPVSDSLGNIQASSIKTLQFDNCFTRELPQDTETQNFPRQVESACYSTVHPNRTPRPQLIAYSTETAHLLGLNSAALFEPLFTRIMSGNELLTGMQPWACCYGGHQFGHWAGQLGDGRAINLAEVHTTQNKHWTLQLKGVGPTPYSRQADGLAVLRSSIREFLCSEAMHHLSVPTTRALSLCLTGDNVMRDPFYDGHAQYEPGAVVCRVASSFIRFGSFEIFARRGDLDNLKKLVNYTLKHDFPHLHITLAKNPKQTYLNWFAEICQSTCKLIVEWMRVGFVHGVMNTDNMSILGQTLDYGPYGWIDNFDLNWTPNTTDFTHRRYRFGNQAAVAQWNLLQLANALYGLIESSEELEVLLHQFNHDYDQQWLQMMRAKLGLKSDHADDLILMRNLENMLSQCEFDMTRFYRQLIQIDAFTPINLAKRQLQSALYPVTLKDQQIQLLEHWLTTYQQRLQDDEYSPAQRVDIMSCNNPIYVLRNYLSQQAIEQAHQGDYRMIAELLDCLRKPYTEQPQYQDFAQLRPDWAKNKPGCSTLSCSS